ncbi:hypothetical protein LCGC14_1122380 [marine sediment metagenome]|uniref:Uncharacterized protein n=1 Tax=marine sediment metagenome TaxID=412755 RepID=A0A0F9PLS0_9ZZZZ
MSRLLDKTDKDKYISDGIPKNKLKQFIKDLPKEIKKILILEKNQKKFAFYDLFDLLKFIYIVRNVRDYGVLIQDCINFSNGTDLVEVLISLNLIEKVSTSISFRKFTILGVTELGNIIGSILVDLYLNNLKFKYLIKGYNRFLLFYIINRKTPDNNKLCELYGYYDFKEPTIINYYIDILFESLNDEVLRDITFWSKSFYKEMRDLFLFLNKNGLCYKASRYVSSRNGELRLSYSMIPGEFIQFLINHKNKLRIAYYDKKLLEVKQFLANSRSFINYFKKYDTEINLLRINKEIENLIIHQIQELKQKKIIEINSIFNKTYNIYENPFNIKKQGEFDKFFHEKEELILIKANSMIQSLIDTEKKLKKSFQEFPLEKKLKKLKIKKEKESKTKYISIEEKRIFSLAEKLQNFSLPDVIRATDLTPEYILKVLDNLTKLGILKYFKDYLKGDRWFIIN